MKYYLVETYNQDLKLRNEDNIIALTPLASYELDKAGIKYRILEDYYDETEFLKEESACFEDQLVWFDKFDNFLFEIFPEAKDKNLKMATSYYFYIKSMVDSLILRCKIINTFIHKSKANSIIYISTNRKEDSINANEYPLLFRKGQSLFSRLMPLFCKKYNIDFQRIILKDVLVSSSIKTEESPINRIKVSLMKNNHIKNLLHLYRTFNIGYIFPESSNKKQNILFLKTNRWIANIMKDAQKDGHKIFYKRGNEIIGQSFGYHKVTNIYPDSIQKMEGEGNKFGLNSETPIIKWLNAYCGIDVTSILLPRFFYIIKEFCPHFISLVDKYVSFYNNNQIDLVFTIHMVDVSEHAAIAATKYSNKTRSVCLQHGDGAFAAKLWDISEYLPYHIYFTTNYEMEEYIKHRINIRKINVKVFQYPERFKVLSKVKSPKIKQSYSATKKIVVFAPTMYQWDNTSWVGLRCPDTWYFSWHKKLINYFSSREDFNFIWKGIPASNETYDPIPNILNDQKYINIKYATEPFIGWLKKADMVLLDYPSTALYEAAVSGLPVMSLYFAPFTIVRKSALKLFGKSLQPFGNFDEGIAKIDDFLNSNPDEFTISIPRSETSILETLNCLNGE